jgi:ATP-dependent Clp protease protease subunit
MVSKQMWMIKQQMDKSTLDIYLYDDIQGDCCNYWTGETIESETSCKHIKETLECCGDVQFINLYINSYGGDVKEGLGIYNILKRHSAYKTAYIDGFACSIASVIPMACDKIVMGVNSLMMVHHASMYVYGNAEQLRKAANDIEVIDSSSCSSYLEKAGDKLNEETLKELLDNQTWLNAAQCIEYGLADAIAGREEDENITMAKQKYNQYLKQGLEHNIPTPNVPEQYNKNKTNAEKLMMAFKKKEVM